MKALWLLLLPVSAGLLTWSLRRAAFDEVLVVLRSLEIWQLLALAGVNFGLIILFSARWWLILTGLRQRVPYVQLSLYRMVGAAVSYVTPGPQFGGEPVQAVFLRRHRLPLPAAISSIFLDRLIELAASFSFLAVGIGLITASGSTGLPVQAAWAPALALLVLPAGHLAALWSGRSPLSSLVGWLLVPLPAKEWRQRTLDLIRQAERQMGDFCRTRSRFFFQAGLVTLVVWAGMILEYHLALRFLGASLTLPETVMALTAARLAFLTPLPAGLGVLEAGQVMALEALGYPPAIGLALSAVIRGRDVIVAAVGLGIGIWIGWDWRKR